jgi:hypothetical protein
MRSGGRFVSGFEPPRAFSEVLDDRRAAEPRGRVWAEVEALEQEAAGAATEDRRIELLLQAEELRAQLHEQAAVVHARGSQR